MRSVVAPKLLLSRAYCSLPMRICSVSSSRTTAASTVSRPSLRCLKSCSTRRRNLGSAFPNSSSPSYFAAVPLLAEVVVVAVLLAPARIHAGRLQVAVGIRAEPCLLIGGRQADGIQPVDLLPVCDAVPLGVEIGPGPARPLSGDPRFGVAAVPQQGVIKGAAVISTHKRAMMPAGSGPNRLARIGCYIVGMTDGRAERMERVLDAVAAAIFAIAASYCAVRMSLGGAAVASVAGLSLCGAFALLRAVPPTGRFRLAEFALADLPDRPGELLLPKPTGCRPTIRSSLLRTIARRRPRGARPDFRVVRLFDPAAMPTPGELAGADRPPPRLFDREARTASRTRRRRFTSSRRASADRFARLILYRQRLDAKGDRAVARKFRLACCRRCRRRYDEQWRTRPRRPFVDPFGQFGRVGPGDTQLHLMPLADEGQRPPFDRSKLRKQNPISIEPARATSAAAGRRRGRHCAVASLSRLQICKDALNGRWPWVASPYANRTRSADRRRHCVQSGSEPCHFRASIFRRSRSKCTLSVLIPSRDSAIDTSQSHFLLV